VARVLIPYWDGGGSVPPLLAMLRVMSERGHDVRVLGTPTLRARVEAAGGRFVAYAYGAGHDPSSPETDLFRDWEPRTPFGVFARVRDRLLCGPALAIARETLAEAEREPPDVIAVDLFLFGAMAAAERIGVPWAALSHTVYPLPAPGRPPFGMGLRPARGPLGRVRDAALTAASVQIFDTGRDALNDARRELGLSALAHTLDQPARAPLTIVLSSRAFDFALDALPASVRYVGAPREPASGQAWEAPWPDDDPRPLVVVSFSTTFQDHRDLVERAVAAFDGLAARALVTTGGVFDPASIAAPPSVAVRNWVPHAAVLPRASAVVTHGGHGTVLAALAAGLPVVAVPCGRDQNDNVMRLLAAGAGVRLRRRARPPAIRRAIERALHDPELRARAQRMADAMAGEDGAAGAVRELEALARR
jgi:MGT family glycosyltransferase